MGVLAFELGAVVFDADLEVAEDALELDDPESERIGVLVFLPDDEEEEDSDDGMR